MTLKCNRVLEVVEYMFVQNCIKLSATVYEFVTEKDSDENNTVVATAESNKNLL